ncbi:MAG: biotin--[acetyl-CoA-carboxylase] ligase [Candidatus Eisenbacteria bacterium]
MADLEVGIILRLKSSARYLTQEELGRTLGVPRGEVVTAMEALTGRGYRIDEVPGEGYRLLETPALLDGCDIRTALAGHVPGREVYTFGKITSTNDVATALARGGAAEGTLVVAEEQSRGRGRQGRQWHSPPGTGLWFSIVLRPVVEAADCPAISLAVALGVSGMLRRRHAVKAKIKWPNDIMVNGRKICGILTEGEFIGSKVSFIVVGVGLNVLTEVEEFPPEIRDIATSLKLESPGVTGRTRVLADLLESIEREYSRFCTGGFEEIRQEILEHSFLVGRLIRVVTGGGEVEGIAHDIDEVGALIVRKDDGSLERVIAGDVVRVN